ncbi:hypothetical protein AOLI_G00071030 [Acnodon oligacanthus]
MFKHGTNWHSMWVTPIRSRCVDEKTPLKCFSQSLLCVLNVPRIDERTDVARQATISRSQRAKSYATEETKFYCNSVELNTVTGSGGAVLDEWREQSLEQPSVVMRIITQPLYSRGQHDSIESEGRLFDSTAGTSDVSDATGVLDRASELETTAWRPFYEEDKGPEKLDFRPQRTPECADLCVLMPTAFLESDEDSAEQEHESKPSQTPLVFRDYSKYARTLDLFDSICSYHWELQKGMTWDKAFFYYALDVACNNSFLLNQEMKLPRKGKSLNKDDFIEGLILQLTSYGKFSFRAEQATEQMEKDGHPQTSQQEKSDTAKVKDKVPPPPPRAPQACVCSASCVKQI